MIRIVLMLSLVVCGCTQQVDESSCTRTAFSGGVLRDCGEVVVFDPAEDDPTVDYIIVDPMGGPLRTRGSGDLVECTATNVPEGRWIVCADGFSRLERDGAAQRVADARL